jgi:hypothetical protein
MAVRSAQKRGIDKHRCIPYGGGVNELPLACTLDAAAGERRLTQWRRVGKQAKIASAFSGRTLAVTYRPQARSLLEELVAAERGCCSFLDWSLEESPERVVLTIRSDESGEPELSRLARLFEASG